MKYALHRHKWPNDDDFDDYHIANYHQTIDANHLCLVCIRADNLVLSLNDVLDLLNFYQFCFFFDELVIEVRTINRHYSVICDFHY